MASDLEMTFANLWVAYHSDIDLHSEWRFAPPRRFRFDFAHLPSKIAIELQGGIFMPNARHINGASLVKEHEKIYASLLSWLAYIFSLNCDGERSIYV